MVAVKQVTQDFDQYIEGLEKAELISLLKKLVRDEELRTRQMWIILKRAGVEGY